MIRETGRILVSALLAFGVAGCSPGASQPDGEKTAPGGDAMESKTVKTDDEWRSLLSDEQYRIARQGGTEAAFSGEYWNSSEKGIYECVCCGQGLFKSDDKFKSGTGWPSFTRPVDPANILTGADKSLGAVRTEVLCSRCDAHLGHVFADGPSPGGMRYCVNSAALSFAPAQVKTPASEDSETIER